MDEATLAESRLDDRVTRRVLPLLFCCYCAAWLAEFEESRVGPWRQRARGRVCRGVVLL